MHMNNLFANLPSRLAGGLTDELVTVLAQSQHVRIERIVSNGQSSAENFWYEQSEHEWVVVLKGEATLFFDGDEACTHLRPGDHVLIAANRRHRVEWTSAEQPTVWLAVFYTDA
ncbi:MAG: cupin 2 domain-containing protein [Gammaproteobacteria bacterium]|jgi:cupin 2 domain-containing protein